MNTNPAPFVLGPGDPAPSRSFPPDREPDWERINSAAQEYNVEVLGPAPEART